MGNLNKVVYTDHQTVITADNLNAIQDSVIQNTSYTTCSTTANTAAKTAALTNFVLTTGSAVKVKFTNSNTAANPTLNVNSTGAKPIMQYGTTVAGTTATNSWDAGAIVEFVYDGTNWVMQGRNTIDAVSKSAGGTFSGLVQIDQADGTTSAQGWSSLVIGNNKATETDGNSAGDLQIYGRTSYKTEIIHAPNSPTTSRIIRLPDANGTIMLDSGGTFTGRVIINEGRSSTTTQTWSGLQLGNNIAVGTASNSAGFIALYSTSQYYAELSAAAGLTANRIIRLPDAAGTLVIDSKEDKTVTTGTTLFNGYYYADGTTSGAIRSLTVVNVTSNRPAFATMISSTSFRVYCPVASTAVTVRIVY